MTSVIQSSATISILFALLILLAQNATLLDGRSWFRLLRRGKGTVPTMAIMKTTKWFPLLEYPGKISWKYPKVKLPSSLGADDIDYEEKDREGLSSYEWSPFAFIAEQQASHENNQDHHSFLYRHKLIMPDDVIEVPSLKTGNDTDISFFQTVVEKSLTNYHVHLQKYLKVLFVPAPSSLRALTDSSKESTKPPQLRRILNTILVSLPQWPLFWKHFTLSTKLITIESHHYNTCHFSNSDPYAQLEITMVDNSGSPTIVTRKKVGMKMSVKLLRSSDGDKVILASSLEYTRLPKAECELIANSILKELHSLMQSEIKLYCARQNFLKKLHDEVDAKRKEEKKSALDKVINPEKYQGKSPNVRRVGDGYIRYRPSSSVRSRHQQVRSK